MSTNQERDHDPIDTVFALYTSREAGAYFGEDVTQLEHALQTAWLAVQESASNVLRDRSVATRHRSSARTAYAERKAAGIRHST